MISVPDYQVFEKLYESDRSLVYRAQRVSDQTSVVLKVLRQEYPSPAAIARFQTEYDILQSLDLEGVVKAYSLESHHQSPAIVLEDFGGESLHRWLQYRPFNLETFLTLAIQITAILGEIHQHQIMHKDINPSNIVLNPKTGQVKIIDFGIATVLSQENPTLRHPSILEGTLAYMSPEQTGRMNRAMDYRTDFYSLGVTLYQLLCDRLPFEPTDAMELVHCHIARQPVPPHMVAPPPHPEDPPSPDAHPPHPINQIPEAVSQIVMKLLAKTAEDRYQSAYGIQADLQECLNQLQQTQRIEPFPLGCWDISSKFQIPQKLYGREREVAELLAAFERVVGEGEPCSPSLAFAPSPPCRSELMLVSGYSGTGKTSLVKELYRSLSRQRGYLIAGKYEQLQRSTPYFALIQAFQELVRQLLTEDEQQLAYWQEKLLAALGGNGQVLIEVIPEIELIIGQQPGVPELPPAESQNRFNLIFENFVRAFTQPLEATNRESTHPLILFLDDLQWADGASLKLIQQLMTVLDRQHLLLIGTYRENQISASHPLTQTLDEIRKAGGIVHQIELLPLGLDDINRLIQETLHCEQGRSLPLAELTLQKTGGNPFFINEFLKALYTENLIRFNADWAAGDETGNGNQETTRESGTQGRLSPTPSPSPHPPTWKWDLSQIRAARLPDSMSELVTARIRELSDASQQILSLAACIGNQFDLQTLAVVSQRSPQQAATDLWSAMQQGLIAPIGDGYKYLNQYLGVQNAELNGQSSPFDTPPLSSESWLLTPAGLTYRFLHDHIQQAAYSLISEAEKPLYHLNVGQQFLKSTAPALLEDRIFEIVNQLNLGSALMTEPDQKDHLAQLNLIAGKKAKASIAYGPALKYLKAGHALLSEDSWHKTYQLTLELSESLAEAAYLTGNFEEMEQQVAEVLSHAKTTLEQTKVHLVRIQAYIAQNKLMDAIHTSLQALEKLGTKLPEQPTQQDITQGLIETKLILTKKQVEELVDLPQMSDPYKLAVMQVIASVCTPTYFLAPELWELMVFHKVQLSINYGNAPGSAFGYADYGMIQCGVEENITAAYQFAQLASTLQSRLNAKEFVPKTTLLVNMYLKHWREHLKETLNPLLEAYQHGLETGDLEYATFAIAFRFYHSYLVGRELNLLEQEIASYEGTIAQFKQQLPLSLTHIYWQVILNLTGQSENPCRLVGNRYNETETLPQLLAANNQYLLFHLFLNKLMLCYLFQDFAEAADYTTTTDQLISQGAVGLLVVPIFYFYDSLVRIAVFSDVSPSEQQYFLQKIAANQQKMEQWANHGPMNYLHKFYLVEAEQHRILGQEIEAADAYDRAIDLAQKHGYVNEEALANELAGKFYLAKGKAKVAQAYLLDARYCYARWGAAAKVKDLDQRYPQFFDRLLEKTAPIARQQRSSSPTATSSTGTAALDLAALMKASQALSDEIVLAKLLEKLMAILIENAGAERGYLLLETHGQLRIEAEGRIEPSGILVLQALSVDRETAGNRIPWAIVNYVVRTQASVVLNQATQDYRFNQDAYILEHQPKSILCTPLVYQGKLSGVVYLENNLITDAFTPDRLEILQFLSTQAAISIDNAQLYNQLELRVQERTAKLTQTNDRLQAEIVERQRSEQTLRMIVEGTVPVVGEDFFRSLVRSLAQALEVRYAFISECVDLVPTRVRSFAFWQGSEFGDNFEYNLQGSPCDQIIHSKGYQCFPEQLQSLFPDDKDLKLLQIQSYAGIPLMDSTGNLLGHLAVLDDRPMENKPRNQAVLEIFAARAVAEMERKQAEEALQISETKFSTAFRSSPDAITISTLRDGRYIEVNDSCLRMLGYRREEILGRNGLELNIWAKTEDQEAIKQLLQQQGTVANLEVNFRKKSGEVFPGLFSAEVIHLENEPCLLAVATDITMLKQAEKALERLAEIGELAAMIVHEVRNPLTTISMGLTSFKKLQLSERFQEYLSLALDEADRLQRLLNQILLYARPQTLQRSQLELNSLVSETLSALQTIPIVSTKPLELITASQPIPVLADRDKLKQVLINLVTNACEAVSDGETVTVRIQEVEQQQVSIQVHNGGPPIPPEVLPKLTKPFFTTKASGTGLGLAIVKRIVEAHNGEFRIESTADAGTTVKVQLGICTVGSA
ncbi:MAG: AAA family ATPase [Kovacikia sp.]